MALQRETQPCAAQKQTVFLQFVLALGSLNVEPPCCDCSSSQLELSPPLRVHIHATGFFLDIARSCHIAAETRSKGVAVHDA